MVHVHLRKRRAARPELVVLGKHLFDDVVQRATRTLGCEETDARDLVHAVVDACDMRSKVECYGRPKCMRQALATVWSKIRRKGARALQVPSSEWPRLFSRFALPVRHEDCSGALSRLKIQKASS